MHKNIVLSRLFISLLLSLPIIIFAIAHFITARNHGLIPTWYYFYDIPYYLANAHQYLDGQHNYLFYSNPFDYSENSPDLYFQPFIYLLSFLLGLNNINPGLCFIVSGYLITLAAFYFLQLLLDKYLSANGLLRVYIIFIVTWGGGALVLSSILYNFYYGYDFQPLRLDPGNGWWCLNLGRNFLIPTEAFYHLLVILLYLSILNYRTTCALIFTCLLAVSHPFTGIQYSLIIFAWIIIEKYFIRSKSITHKTVILYSIPLLFCIIYYLIFLPIYPIHRIVMSQWTLDWSMGWPVIFGAYSLVTIPVIIRICSKQLFLELMQKPFNRFLIVCALISFILANHDMLLSQPVQPLHFAHGYIWMPLCLLGLPVIAKVHTELDRKYIFKIMAAVLFFILIFIDNLVWFTENLSKPEKEFMLTSPQKTVMAYLNTRKDSPIIISNDLTFSYLSTVYTRARPYYGHMYNTPYAKHKLKKIKKFFTIGREPDELAGQYYLIVIREYNDRSLNDLRYKLLFSAGDMKVYEHNIT